MAIRIGRLAVFAIAAFLATTPPLAAQQPEGPERRVINGHAFIPNSLIPDPFVNTFVGSRVGVGTAVGLKVPILDLEGDSIGVLDGDLAFLNLGFEYQQALGSWIAVRGSFQGNARLGTDGTTLITQGVTGGFGFGLGTTVKLWRTDKIVLNGVVDFKWSQLYAVTPFRWLQDIIDGGLDPDSARLLDDGKSTSLTGGGRFAWAPINWFGLRANAEFGFGSPFDPESRSGNRGVWRFETVGDVDLGTITSVPIGFALGFRSLNFTDSGSELVDRIFNGVLGISYTGRSDFNIGLETTFGTIKLKETVVVGGEEVVARQVGQSIDSGSILIRLTYYF